MNRIFNTIIILLLFCLSSVLAEEKKAVPGVKAGAEEKTSPQKTIRELFRRGRIYYMKGDFERAKTFFSGVVGLDPENSEAWHFLGGTKHRLGDYAGAIADYSRAIKLNPRGYHSYHNRALSKHYQNKPGSAIGDYSKAIEINRDYFRSWYFRGLAKLENGDYSGAMEDMSIFLLMKPENYRAWYIKGLARYRSGDTEGALKDFQQALRLSNKALPPYRGNINPFGVSKKSSPASKEKIAPVREKAKAKSF